MKLHDRIKNIIFPAWTVPLFLLVITIFSFGLLINHLGFYWDDWAKSLVHHLYGVNGYIDYYAYDRPLSAWTHILLFPLLGEVPINWQIFTLSMRWLSAVTMWWSLSLLWPYARRQVTFAAALFLVYPSFTQQPIAVTFHQQWMQYVLFFLSIGLMILAVRKNKLSWLFTIASALLLGLQITITEYFIPLELLRPFILWFLLDKDKLILRLRVFKVIQLWAPYLFIVLAYIVWRQFFMQLVEEDPYRMTLLSSLFLYPIGTLKHLIKVVIIDAYSMLIACWAPVLDMGLPDHVPTIIWKGWAVSILVVIVITVFFRIMNFNQTPTENGRQNWVIQAAIIGFIVIFLGTLPAWLIERSAIDDFHANRYTLPAMWGISLLFICLMESLVKKGFHQSITLAVVIGLAIAFHIRTADEYRDLWQDQVSFYWQLYWRAPYIEHGTALILEEEPFPNQGLFSTSSAINFLYPQPKNIPYLGYYVYTLRPRYSSSIPEPLEINFKTSFRSLSFIGSTPNSLLIYYDLGRANCMWVLDPERDQDEPGLTDLTRSFLPISNFDQIISSPISDDYPLVEIIGPEPQGEWCYFYQKAELARQNNNWQIVSDLIEEAKERGFEPTNGRSKTPHEWLVFIEGYAYFDQWDSASEITKKVSEIAYGQYDEKLCSLWDHIIMNTDYSPEREGITSEIKVLLNCKT